MKKKLAAFVQSVKKHKIITTLIGIFIIIIATWGITAVMPHPLGDKLEYLGKKDFGCWIGFCDSKPGSTYYYATNMGASDTSRYFQKSQQVQDIFTENRKEVINIRASNGEAIYIYHYSSKDFAKFKTDKPYIIEIPSFKYQAALDSL